MAVRVWLLIHCLPGKLSYSLNVYLFNVKRSSCFFFTLFSDLVHCLFTCPIVCYNYLLLLIVARMADKLTRIALVNSDKCKPKKCRQECKKSCPVVRMGK
jgi:hypothetical protein